MQYFMEANGDCKVQEWYDLRRVYGKQACMSIMSIFRNDKHFGVVGIKHSAKIIRRYYIFEKTIVHSKR